MWHFFLIFCLIYAMMAAISSWQFGGSVYGDTYGTFGGALAMQFHFMIGELNDIWNQNSMFAIYFLVFMVFIFFLMLNFLLSIVIEAFLGVKKDLEDQITEQGFIADVIDLLRTEVKSWYFGWPKRHDLVVRLRLLYAKRTIGVGELRSTGTFDTTRAAVSFVEHYCGYSFLAPVKKEEAHSHAVTQALKQVEAQVARLEESVTLSKPERFEVI